MGKMMEMKGRDAFGRRLLLGGTATLALAAAISAAPINFERSLSGEFGSAVAHADGGEGGEGGDGGGDGGGGEGGGDGGSGGGGEGGGDSDGGGDSGGEGGEGGDDSGGESGESSDDDGTPDQGTGDVPVDPNAPVVLPGNTSGN